MTYTHAQELEVRTATVTPWYHGLWTLFKYRTSHNYRDGEFLGPRIGDKIIIGLIVITLFLRIGRELTPSNVNNILCVMFMCVDSISKPNSELKTLDLT